MSKAGDNQLLVGHVGGTEVWTPTGGCFFFFFSNRCAFLHLQPRRLSLERLSAFHAQCRTIPVQLLHVCFCKPLFRSVVKGTQRPICTYLYCILEKTRSGSIDIVHSQEAFHVLVRCLTCQYCGAIVPFMQDVCRLLSVSFVGRSEMSR